jgi:nitrogen-specific signal transduction histidine kinase
MNALPRCIGFSREAAQLDRWRAILAGRADLGAVSTLADLASALELCANEAVVLADARDGEGGRGLCALMAVQPAPFIVFAGEHTEPARLAAADHAYAVEPPQVPPERLLRAVYQAWDLIRLRHAAGPSSAPSAPASPQTAPPPPLPPAAQVLRSLGARGRWEQMVCDAAEAISSGWILPRTGAFVRGQDGAFRFAWGVGCPEGVGTLVFRERDAAVIWMQRHPCVIATATLEQTAPADLRPFLAALLDALGAEVLLPLHARGGIVGWIFAGRRGNGLPYAWAEIEECSALAWQLGTLIENRMLAEQQHRRQEWAGRLLDALPVGVLATDGGGVVTRINAAAERMLAAMPESLPGHPAEAAGGRIAGLVRAALAGGEPSPAEWEEPLSGARLRATARRMDDPESGPAAVVYLEDVTAVRRAAERTAEADRAALWQELARALAHEIRNPLVAIRAAGQLLPEQHADPEFRREFTALIESECGRLDGLVERVEDVAAAAPNIERTPLALPELVARAVEAGKKRAGSSREIPIACEPALPPVTGVADRIERAVEHLVANALEALPEGGHGGVRVAIGSRPSNDGVRIAIEDDGRGIDPALKDRLFSPFATTKHQTFGIGLPLVRRCVTDHGGELHIHTSDQGTRMTLVLFSTPPDRP